MPTPKVTPTPAIRALTRTRVAVSPQRWSMWRADPATSVHATGETRIPKRALVATPRTQTIIAARNRPSCESTPTSVDGKRGEKAELGAGLG
jgi:hypothetical protein